MIIATLGLPGSGKTSASKILAKALAFRYVGAGDIARKLAETDEETKQELDQGKIAPPGKMREAMIHEFQPNTILDGYPRYWEQLADLYYYTRQRKPMLIYVAFQCRPEEAFRRLTNRNRSDDTMSQINQRVANYRNLTLPVLSYLMMNHEDSVVTIPQQHSARDAAEMAYDYIQDQWIN
jgi:adenylate kinase family enzyme